MSLSSTSPVSLYRRLPARKDKIACVLVVLGIGLALAITFSRWNASSALAFPKFVGAAALLFVIPGSQIVAWCRLKATALEHAMLSALLGMVATCFLYALVSSFKVPALLYLWIAATAAAGGLRLWRAKSLAAKNLTLRSFAAKSFAMIDRDTMLVLIGICVALLPMWILPFFYRNLSLSADGSMVFFPNSDLLIHFSLANELAREFPPQMPFVSGQPLNYHVGMDLVAAVLHRFGGVPVIDAVVRFCPTLFVAIDVVAVYSLARRLGVSAAVGVATAALTMLGEDFSFIPGLLQRSDSIWAIAYLGAPTVFSLYAVNPMVTGLGLLFASLLCLFRYIEERRGAWIVAAAICCVGLLETKIFVFILLMLSLGVVVGVEAVVLRRSTLLKPSLAILVFGLPFAFLAYATNRATSRIMWGFASPLSGHVQSFILTSHWTWLQNSSLAGLGVYLAMTFGFRIVGFGELVRSFRLTADGGSFKFLLAVMVVLGTALTLLSTVTPADSTASYNNSIWFMVTSKYVATLFVGIAIERFWRRFDPRGGALIMIAVVLASLPSTVQYLERYSSRFVPVIWQPSIVEAADYLNRNGQAGQVALTPLSDPVLALTSLHVPLRTLGDFAARAAAADRQRDVEDFWQSWQRGEPHGDILAKYHVTWIVVGRAQTPRSLEALSRMTVASMVIEKCFANADVVIYRTSPMPPSDKLAAWAEAVRRLLM